MTVGDLKNYLLINTALDISEDDIDDNVLNQILNYVLPIYGKYRPLSLRDRFNIDRTTIFDKDNYGRSIVGIEGIYIISPELSNYNQLNIIWSYDINSKTLYTNIGGSYLIAYQAIPLLEDIQITDDLFFNLILGKYMMYIGEQRKQFSLDDLPFSNDGEELYRQGEELFNSTLENISNNLSSWYKAIEI